MMIQWILPPPVVHALGWSLIHSLWQGGVVVAVFACCLVFLRRSSANSRYALSCATLFLLALLPVLTFVHLMISEPEGAAPLGKVESGSAAADALDRNGALQIADTGEPETAVSAVSVPPAEKDDLSERETRDTQPMPPSPARAPVASFTPSPPEQESPAGLWGDWRAVLGDIIPWLVAAWLAGVLVLSLRLLGGWMYLQRLKHRYVRPVPHELRIMFDRLADRMRVSRPVRLLESTVTKVPVAVGWLKPVVLLPTSVLTGLTPEQLEAILAHELAHIRRYDYLMNALQTVIETLLYYHPGVWWVSRRIRIERENSCDDAASTLCGGALTYAQALAQLETLRQVPPVLALGAKGGRLVSRIRRLADPMSARAPAFSRWLAGAVSLGILLLLLSSLRVLSQSVQSGQDSRTEKGVRIQMGLPSFPGFMAGWLGDPDLDERSWKRLEAVREHIDAVFEGKRLGSLADFPAEKYAELRGELEAIANEAADAWMQEAAKRRLVVLHWLAGKASADGTVQRLLKLAATDEDPRSAEFTKAYAVIVLCRAGIYEETTGEIQKAVELFRTLSAQDTPQFGSVAFQVVRNLSDAAEVRNRRQNEEDYARKVAFADFIEDDFVPAVRKYLEAGTAYNSLERVQLMQVLDMAAERVHRILSPRGNLELSKRCSERTLPMVLDVWEAALALLDPQQRPLPRRSHPAFGNPETWREEIDNYRQRKIPHLKRLQRARESTISNDSPPKSRSEYNHVLFVRQDELEDGSYTDTLVLAKVTDPVQLHDIYTRHNFNITWKPICFVNEIVYGVASEELVGIAPETGELVTLCTNLGSASYDDGRIYASFYDPTRGKMHRIFDVQSRAYRDTELPVGGGIVSPDHRRLALFAEAPRNELGLPDYTLRVIDLVSGEMFEIGRECHYSSAWGIAYGSGITSPPFVWVDSETILYIWTGAWRREPRRHDQDGPVLPASGGHKLSTVNVITGEVRDIALLPGTAEQDNASVSFGPLDPMPRVFMIPRRVGAYRGVGDLKLLVDLVAGELIEDSTGSIGGDYSARGHELRWRDTILDLGYLPRYRVKVSPDGKRVAWFRGESKEEELLVHDAETDEVRKVFQGRLGDRFLWVRGEGLGKAAEIGEVPQGWIPFSGIEHPPTPAPPSDTRKRLSESITLDLETDRQTYQQHEPVELKITMRNISDEDIEIPRPRVLDDDCIELRARMGQSRWIVPGRKAFAQKDNILLKAGTAVSATDILEVASIGEHEITAKFPGIIREDMKWRGWVRSRPATFRVVSGTDEDRLVRRKFTRILARNREGYVGDLTAYENGLVGLGPRVAPWVVEEIKASDDAELRRVLLIALTRLRNPETVPFLGERLLHGEDYEQRVASGGLWEFYVMETAPDEAVGALTAALRDGETNARWWAARLLGRISHPRVVEAFEKAVNDPDVRVCRIAARYLAATEGVDLIEWLSRASEEPSATRYAATRFVIQDLEEMWHTAKGEFPQATWEGASQNAQILRQYHKVVNAWAGWAKENPRYSAKYFDGDREHWEQLPTGGETETSALHSKEDGGSGNEPMSPDGITVRGRVVDPDGEPIAGAEVRVRGRAIPGPSSTRDLDGFIGHEVAVQTTDGEGRFSFKGLSTDSPSYELICTHPAYHPVLERVLNRPPGVDYEVRLVMDPGVTLRGTVVDTLGNPIPGARVGVGEDETRKETHTGEDGRFELPGVAASDDGLIRCFSARGGYVAQEVQVTPHDAVTGEWRIVLLSEEELSISGRAIFTDGNPVSNMELLHFQLTDENGRHAQQWKQSGTDSEGGFQVVLPRAGLFSGTVWAVGAPGNGIPFGRWRTQAEGLRTGRNDVELVFDNRGSIEVTIEPSNQLPREQEFEITCRTTSARYSFANGVIGTKNAGAGGGRAVFPYLSPGDYVIQVQGQYFGKWYWTNPVQLPDEGGNLETAVRITVPEVRLGRLRARILEPDEERPVSDGNAELWGARIERKVSIRDGVVEINDAPAGPVSLSVRCRGYPPVKVEAAIREGETTDLGEIVLPRVEEVAGWVEGGIVFEDGTAAVGATFARDFFDKEVVKADGRFRRQLPAGKQFLGIGLGGVPLWPRWAAPNEAATLWRTNRLGAARDLVLVAVDVVAGGTVVKDVILDRTDLGDVSIRWVDAQEAPSFMFFVQRDGQIFGTTTTHWPPEKVNTIENVPVGDRILIVRQGGFCGCYEAKQSGKDTLFVVDPKQAGSITGSVKLEDRREGSGTELRGQKVALYHPSLVDVGVLRGVWADVGVQVSGKVAETETGAEGIFQFPTVGPGRYLVRVKYGDAWDEAIVEVKEGEESEIELTVGSMLGRVGEGPGLRYEVTPRETEIPVYGSLWFNARLSNEGDEPVLVYWGDYAYDDQYRFTITRKDGKEIPAPWKRLMPSVASLDISQFMEVPPGGQVDYSLVLGPSLGANTQTYYFREAGEYVARPSFVAVVVAVESGPTGRDVKIKEVWRGILEAKAVAFTVHDTGERAENFGSINVEGEVVNTEGEPIAGAHVVIEKRVPGSMNDTTIDGFVAIEIDRQVTDEQGQCVFFRLPASSPSFILVARHPQYHRSEAKVVNEPPKTNYKVCLVMDPGIRIRGTVVDSAGDPIVGVRVYATIDYLHKEAYTDENGRFEIPGVVPHDDGVIQCEFAKRGYVQEHAKAPEEVAQSGSWKITLMEPDELRFSGRAVFADGAPAAYMKIHFFVRKEDGGFVWLPIARTDASGWFSTLLREQGTFSGVVWAEDEGGDQAPHGRWQAAFEGVAAGRDDVEIVFENSGRIEVTVEPANELPPFKRFAVTCRIKGSPWGRVDGTTASTFVGPEGGTTVLGNLSAGEYVVSTKVSGEEAKWSWSKEVSLPDEAGTLQAKVGFRLPEIEFGGLRARVFEPDEKTPVREGEAVLGTVSASRSVLIRNGLIEFDEVPAGGVSLSIWREGYARPEVKGVVRAGETTDLGDIVLVPEAEATGWVEGRVLYDDGTPALGVTLGDDPFRQGTVRADGSFRRRLPVGKRVLTVGLRGAPLWPRAAGLSGLNLARTKTKICDLALEDKILVPVEIKPGQTVTKDVVVHRSGIGDVTISWPGGTGQKVWTAFFARKGGQTFAWCCSRRLEEEKITIQKVPPGDRILIARADDYSGCQEVADSEGDIVFTIDAREAGSISGKVMLGSGGSVGGKKVTLYHPDLADVDECRLSRPDWGYIPIGSVSQTETAEDGAFRFSKVGPGRYLMRVEVGDSLTEAVVEVKEGEEAQLELVVGEG